MGLEFVAWMGRVDEGRGTSRAGNRRGFRTKTENIRFFSLLLYSGGRYVFERLLVAHYYRHWLCGATQRRTFRSPGAGMGMDDQYSLQSNIFPVGSTLAVGNTLATALVMAPETNVSKKCECLQSYINQ